MLNVHKWPTGEKSSFNHHPFSIFEENAEQLPSSYGVIILNYSKPSMDKWLTYKIWSQAKIRACADGGSNELRKFTFEKKNEHFKNMMPTFIIGDLDSIKADTQQFYAEEHNVRLIKIEEQDSTDFTKCLQELEKETDGQPLQEIYVFCTFAGRFDQAMSLIHTLYLYPKLNIFLVSDRDITFLLKPGLNYIHQIQSPLCGEYCSLIPFAGPLKIVTNGLEWDLDEKMELNFNTLISTSNAYKSPKGDFVTIDTPAPLIWSMTFANDD